MVMTNTNIIRLGPEGFNGTDAPFTNMKAGVRSCNLALDACNCVFNML
jgi:hypothetical protein